MRCSTTKRSATARFTSCCLERSAELRSLRTYRSILSGMLLREFCMTGRDYVGPDSAGVREMFAGIAPRYDFLNHFLSASIDRRWRQLAVRKVRELVGESPGLCLDSCTGTGDLAIALVAGLRTSVIASDF